MMRMDSNEELTLSYDLFKEEIGRLRKYNKYASLIVGFSGIWWLWIIGFALVFYFNSYFMIAQALLITLIIFYISTTFSQKSHTNIKWIVRGIAIFEIVTLSKIGIGVGFSIVLFSAGVIFQDYLNILNARALRTQRFVSYFTPNHRLITLLQSNTKYLKHRLNWAFSTAFFVFISGLSLLILSKLINFILKLNEDVIKVIQYISFGSLLLLFIIMVKYIFPSPEKFKEETTI